MSIQKTTKVRSISSILLFHWRKLSQEEELFYFYAPWCGTSAALDNAIQQRGSELPPDFTILKIDFDNAGELSRKYGIAFQHLLVSIDKQGSELDNR